MTAEQQRYCPLCDKLLISGEAVLQCSKCQRLHHPACWVKNEGCSLMCAGAIPMPVAYTPPAPSYQPAHPAEGTRVAASPPPARGLEAPRDPVERVEPVSRPASGPPRDPGPAPRPGAAGGEPMIGQVRPNAGGSKEPPAPVVIDPPPRANRGRYTASDGKAPSVEDMKLYRDGGILRFWYIPVAGLLAIAVAVGVIFAADALFGGGDDETPAGGGSEQETPTIAETPGTESPATTPTADAAETPASAETPGEGTPEATAETSPTPGTPAEPGDLAVGMSVVIVNTGECLNIRSAAGTDNEIMACLEDGVTMNVIGGPEEADGLTWWQLDAEGASGWGAADYLAPAEAQ